MQNLTLKTNTGESLPLQVPTSWYDVTVSQYADIYDKPIYEQMAMLIKLDKDRFLNIDVNSFAHLCTYMEFLNEKPENKDAPFPKNIGKQSIGQYELCKKYINLYQDKNIWHLAPYIYVIYMMPDRYDLSEVFVMGMPKALLDEVRQMPIIEVYSPVNFFLSNLNASRRSMEKSYMKNRIASKCKQVLKRLTFTVFSVR